MIGFLKRFFEQRVTVPFLGCVKDPVVVLSRDGRVIEGNDPFYDLVKRRKEGLVGLDSRTVEPLNVLWNFITESLVQRIDRTERLVFNQRIFDVTISTLESDTGEAYTGLVFRDITSSVALESEILKRNRELVITNTLSSVLITSADLDTIYPDILEKVLLISGMPMGWIVIEEAGGGSSIKSRSGVPAALEQALLGPEFISFYRAGMETASTMHVSEADDPGFPEHMKREGVLFCASVQLRHDKRVVGLLVLASRVTLEMDFDLASILSLIGNHISLIAEKISLFQETHRLSITDALTELHNQRFFYQELEQEVERTRRYRSPFSLILFDIDDFKALNDRFGHQAGDDVLRAVADVLRKSARKADVVARYGGEEFIIILPNTDKDMAHKLAVRIKDSVEKGSYLDESPATRVTISGGVAMFPEDAVDSKGILYAADMAMYAAKAAGKNRIMNYERPK